jgi:hypothetical protein
MKRMSALVIAAALGANVTIAAAAPRSAVERTDRITPQQRTLLNEKLALVAAIMRNAGTDRQSAQVDATKQRWMMESLYALPLSELRAIGMPGSYDQAAVAIARANVKLARDVNAKLGELDTELVYIPITPCRFIDTRNVGGRITGTPIGSRSYDLDLTGAAYGGSAACNPKAFVANDANNIGAIAINLAIVDPALAPGFMGARPFGSTNTTSMVNWYEAGPTVQASNAGIVTSDQTLVADEIEFFGTTAHIVVDVLGMFSAPTSTALDCVTGTLTTTNVTAGATFSLDAGACPANYRMVSNSCQTLGSDLSIRLSEHGVINATTANCTGVNSSGGTLTVTNTPWCCRLPGR